MVGGIGGDIVLDIIGDKFGSLALVFIGMVALAVLWSGKSMVALLHAGFQRLKGLAESLRASFAYDDEDEKTVEAAPAPAPAPEQVKPKVKPAPQKGPAPPKPIVIVAKAPPKPKPKVRPLSNRNKPEDSQMKPIKSDDERISLIFEEMPKAKKRKAPMAHPETIILEEPDGIPVRTHSKRPRVDIDDEMPVMGMVGEINAESASTDEIPQLDLHAGGRRTAAATFPKPMPKPGGKPVIEYIDEIEKDAVDDSWLAEFTPGEDFDEAASGIEDEIRITDAKSMSGKPYVDPTGRPSEVFLVDEPPAIRSMSISPTSNEEAIYKNYKLPPIDLLDKSPYASTTESRARILENSRKLEETLRNFRVEAKVVAASVGPTVTRYELAPGQGVKVSQIANLSNDLALSLAAQGIRIEAPIPGKSAVGVEIPNKEMQSVYLRDILEDEVFRRFPSKMAFAVGKDIEGKTVVGDISRMPHLLIAGATGSGKSVCINTLIASVLYKAKPNEVKLLMIDPKVVELSVYNGIPHLLAPVVTDPKKASATLGWAVTEMDIRYNLFAEANVRDLKSYNAQKAAKGDSGLLPQIIIIIDELADLMMMAKGEIEELICRLAQKARAAGLHLIIATQRPSVDVITGLIKANIPSRLAFAVSSGTDSRTVLDMTGAEKLLGKGDMLFLPVGKSKPVRVQCGFITDGEVERLVDYLKSQSEATYDQDMVERITDTSRLQDESKELDEFYKEAVEFLIDKGKASASMLQRQFRIGYNRASRLIEDLEDRGIVGPEDGSKPRKVLITMAEWKREGI
jgi:S-DNA-T family DNA segregation ATPase FtsK/SpoIIIE